MGLNLGAFAAGVGAGYMVADKWKKGKKKAEVPLNAQPGMEPLEEPKDPTAGMEDGGYADGGLVGGGCMTSYGGQGCGAAGVNRWMKK